MASGAPSAVDPASSALAIPSCQDAAESAGDLPFVASLESFQGALALAADEDLLEEEESRAEEELLAAAGAEEENGPCEWIHQRRLEIHQMLK